MNAPDPNCPQTPLGHSLVALRDRMKASGAFALTYDEIDRLARGEKQPDAIARLEAWCNATKTRTYQIYGGGVHNSDGMVRGPATVKLFEVGKTEIMVTEHGPMTFRLSVDGKPGLAATIEAALDKAAEVKL